MSDLCGDCQRSQDFSDGSELEIDDAAACTHCTHCSNATSDFSSGDDEIVKTRSASSDDEEEVKHSALETPGLANETGNGDATAASDIPKSRQVRSVRGRRHIYSVSVMPSGMKLRLWIPAAEKSYRKWKCGTKSHLIELGRKSYLGRKEYNIIVKEMEKTRGSHASGAFSGYDIVKIEKIVNQCLWNRFRIEKKNIEKNHKYSQVRLLFHGSPAWEEVTHQGFNESYAQMGGMFGAGIYFASNSSKSNQYVFGLGNPCPTHSDTHCFTCVRHMLICRVALGRMKTYQTAQSLSHPPPGYDSVKGEANPLTSIFGLGLKYDEYIVYKGEQIYPEFLISYKIKN